MRYQDIVEWLHGKVGHGLNGDEGLRFGIPRDPLRKVLVCWMVTMPAAREAVRWGADLIISHEAMFHPYYLGRRSEIPEEHMSWRANVDRIKPLAQADVAVMRCHGSGDDSGFLDAFLDQLGLEGEFEGEGYRRVCNIRPTTVHELAERIKCATGMEGLRVAARNLDVEVRRVGFPYGGLGLQLNMGFLNEMQQRGCDCVIAGESDSYAMQFVMDCGMALIETSHEVSENPGLARLAARLDADFPDAEFRYFETARPFRIL